ncbi:hypothetical protein Poli38472_006145 [Pythium oligandrum]|uniref:Transcription factor Pcc1 n=1 Tax=Pythium oligandrum TaxID=41045 RepID=A0A8K1CRT8_PYTOL|nr:hypothetical protein Poli38472_006145 [Pythium oligandrum]|eukprot:TMW68677.1 hypothetical protein Poli38472_006145 [Pythium oligandrum]
MTSATHPYECDIRLSFPEAEDAEHAMLTIQVDEELQPDKIHRSLSVDGTDLIVHFEATEIRLLRAAVASFYDMSLLVARTLLEFKE